MNGEIEPKSRRDFIASAAGATAVATLAGCATTGHEDPISLPRTTPAAPVTFVRVKPVHEWEVEGAKTNGQRKVPDGANPRNEPNAANERRNLDNEGLYKRINFMCYLLYGINYFRLYGDAGKINHVPADRMAPLLQYWRTKVGMPLPGNPPRQYLTPSEVTLVQQRLDSILTTLSTETMGGRPLQDFYTFRDLYLADKATAPHSTVAQGFINLENAVLRGKRNPKFKSIFCFPFAHFNPGTTALNAFLDVMGRYDLYHIYVTSKDDMTKYHPQYQVVLERAYQAGILVSDFRGGPDPGDGCAPNGFQCSGGTPACSQVPEHFCSETEDGSCSAASC